MLVEQDIFELQVAMDAMLLVDVCDSSDELSECLLDLVDREFTMPKKVVIQLLACVWSAS